MYRITVYLTYPDGVCDLDFPESKMADLDKVLLGLVGCENLKYLEVSKLNYTTGMWKVIERVKNGK